MDSTTAAWPSFSTDFPGSGTSAKTISPNNSVACFVIPTVATSPSSETHSCFFENFFHSFLPLFLFNIIFFKNGSSEILPSYFFPLTSN